MFYEDKLGFKATHLSDEKMPHIRLVRDNIVIALVESPVMISPLKYDLIIYISEPLLLYHELKASGVKIIEELPEAKASEKAETCPLLTSTVDFSRDGLSMTASRPHLLHVILHSAPTLVRVHSKHPQGCFFFILTISPTSYLYRKNLPGISISLQKSLDRYFRSLSAL